MARRDYSEGDFGAVQFRVVFTPTGQRLLRWKVTIYLCDEDGSSEVPEVEFRTITRNRAVGAAEGWCRVLADRRRREQNRVVGAFKRNVWA